MRFIRGLLARVSVNFRSEFNLKASAFPACEPWFIKLPTRRIKFKISGRVSFFKIPVQKPNKNDIKFDFSHKILIFFVFANPACCITSSHRF